MSFINIFNYKKYFKKTSDAQVARVGHVNAVYSDLNLTKAEYSLPDGEGDVNITTKAGVIFIEAGIQSLSDVRFNILSESITTQTVLIATVINESNALTAVNCVRETGAISVSIANMSLSQASGVYLHFLII